jgi:hypothetical protein
LIPGLKSQLHHQLMEPIMTREWYAPSVQPIVLVALIAIALAPTARNSSANVNSHSKSSFGTERASESMMLTQQRCVVIDGRLRCF